MNAKQKIVSVKNHIVRNRGKYSALATAVAIGVVYRAHVREVDEFLDAHGLKAEFYTPEEI